MRVVATREGLIGQATASGYVIDRHVAFVSLPSEKALHKFVRITNPITGDSTIAQVLDVGPHFTDDEAYVFQGARPRAETERPNRAGIDLGEWVWLALQMTDNGPVVWDFVE